MTDKQIEEALQVYICKTQERLDEADRVFQKSGKYEDDVRYWANYLDGVNGLASEIRRRIKSGN